MAQSLFAAPPSASMLAHRWRPSYPLGAILVGVIATIGLLEAFDFMPAALGACALALAAALLVIRRNSGRATRDATDQFRRLFESLPVPMVITDPGNETILYVNLMARTQFGLPEAQSNQNERPRDAASLFCEPTDQWRIADLVRERGLVDNLTIELKRRDGTRQWALVSAHRVEAGGISAIASSFVDVTDFRATEAALLNSEVRYALISRAANDGIFDWDLLTGHVYYSARWREIAAVEPSMRLSTLDDWFALAHGDDLPALRQAIDDHVAGVTRQLDIEYRLHHGDGRYGWIQCRAIVLRGRDGTPIRMAGSQSDITLRKTYELNLRNAAYEDRLTGLKNRTFFTQLIDQKVDSVSIIGGAVLLINIDQFKRVNDNFGTTAGDALLIAVALRLVERLKPADSVARLGGDEFAIHCGGIGDVLAATRFCDALCADLSQPFLVGDAQIGLTLSMGLATADQGDARSGADLLHHARLALDRSKQLGGNRYTLFDDVLLHESKLRQRLSRDLASAGKLGQISLDYQPLVALSGPDAGEIAGFEALMRWRHPELGAIPPAHFIPLAEDGGMIGPLGILAIEQAARDLDRWNGSGLASGRFSVAVNLSVRQISDAMGISRLYDALDRVALPRGSLKLEITESVLMNDPDEMVKVLGEFRDRGIGLSLDDFGTGYSSLSHLHRFPLDMLKIDRSFITRMLHAPEALRLVRSIIDLGHDLGLSVVAEGVECAAEVDRLRQMGCDFAQGYYYSKPVPAAEAERLLIEGVRQHEYAA